eukprot:SAG31_NODE_30985_length_373_cov_2.828467_1_plen_69_part_10
MATMAAARLGRNAKICRLTELRDSCWAPAAGTALTVTLSDPLMDLFATIIVQTVQTTSMTFAIPAMMLR